ncbi:MAG: CYTH domain-containing protein [Epulopiscium sp.]|nr:CYTH domain-containing protein [Candidatus Epulonipiscium sp.]HOQ17442.1 CYTH domain-containing protein [Defluviitaleaceae bacterium]HPT76431.1 CYTH domain-containing protein [Defluviitaleaceae bacterium]
MEIERKYLVKRLPENLHLYEKEEIIQGYISIDPIIRLRKSNDNYCLTIKSKGHLKREEVEFPLTKEQFESLWQKVDSNTIYKSRYNIPLENNLVAELDVYHGDLEDLLTVEVEFESEKASEKFTPPDWFGKDVTHDNRYKNSNLAVYGIPKD